MYTRIAKRIKRRKYSLATAAVVVSSLIGYRRYVRWRSDTYISQNELTFLPFKENIPHRLEQIDKLTHNDEFDLLIIGGGATGAGVALDATTRGLKVALVERDDFASGTSCKSTKLVHGGVRYLEKAFKNFDFDQFKLVQEALGERYTFLKIAPHLTNALPIMLPMSKWYLVPYYWAGSKVYDLIAGMYGLQGSYYLPKDRALSEFPMLRPDKCSAGAMVYFDGQFNDSRMNVSIALTAAQYGAVVANYVEVLDLIKDENGNAKGAILRDSVSGNTWDVKAKGIINATGPFTDAVRKMEDDSINNIVVPSAGTHVVLPDHFSPSSMGLLDPSTSDGRVIFFLPWQNATIAGTTDALIDVTKNPKPSEKEIHFILHEISSYLDPSIPIRRGDVLAAWSGIRPLVLNPEVESTEELSRSHLVHVGKANMITIAGGKWTTYRKMAEDVVDKAIDTYNLKPIYSKSITKRIPIIGGRSYQDCLNVKLIQQFGLDKEVAGHLAHAYGDRAYDVAKMAQYTEERWPVRGKRIVPLFPYIEAEIEYAIENEYAVSATDFVARRINLATIDSAAAMDALPTVVEKMGKKFNWTEEKKLQELKDGKDFLFTMGLVDQRDFYSSFNKIELSNLREAFSSKDLNHDGYIDLVGLKAVCIHMGQHIGKEEIMILERNGTNLERIQYVDFIRLLHEIKQPLQGMDSYGLDNVLRSGGGL
eukprot:TRINITY_DN6516_c0_g5_i1.p1 TRINITY_DN6516_c0_g5~~TRINITY_DN6516_c0_g5_i1.p1  ORF type:complete len:706 (+),score=154.16 TRINITY_DN6516_c0_g5_i1:60-2177(+)